MDLDTVRQIVRPATPQELPSWQDGDAWLAGGTWLFSEPQPNVRRLIDLGGFGWPALLADEAGLHIAATCRIAELYGYDAPADWTASPLIRSCCEALAASFKVWNTATVGGNLCLALPAGALIALAVALEGTCAIWQPGGGARLVPAANFVTDVKQTVLRPGELLRSISLPLDALRRTAVVRRAARSAAGISSALLIGTAGGEEPDFSITISAATRRPVRLDFAGRPTAAELRAVLDRAVPPQLYFDDAHGTADYRRHVTQLFAEDIRRVLDDEAASCRSG